MLKAGEKKMELAQANKESISELKKAKANLEVELQEKTLRLKELEESFEYLFQHSLYPILLINLKGRFVEINNPLAIISGYAQMLQAEPTMDEARKERYLKEIVEQTDRTARIMRKVKDFARPGETRMESVTHSLVNRHHGTIAVESEVGKGTTFVITFPLSSEEAEK